MSIGVVLEEKKEEYKFVYKIKSSSNRNFMKGVVIVLSRRLGINVEVTLWGEVAVVVQEHQTAKQ